MSHEQIQTKVIELAAEQAGVATSEVTPATHFVNDLNFDSLDAVEFAMAVEDEFELSIPDADAEKLQTVGDMIEYVAQRVPAGSVDS